MSISFITQETVDGSLDSSNFYATNEIEDTLNSIITSIEESWDSNSDKVDDSDKFDDSVTTSDGSMFAPNNDFSFTNANFLPLKNSTSNKAICHHKERNQAWYHIQFFTGNVVSVGTGDDAIDWKVVHGVFEDEMAEIINVQSQAQERNELNFIENTTQFKYDPFTSLWLGDFWNDYKLLNEVIKDYNETRKKKLQKVIQIVTKAELIVFHALLILVSQISNINKRL